MKALDWIPEAYPRSGGLAAAGFYKLLGRPRLDPLTVLVRETAQNSWDARLPNTVVRFGIEGWNPMWDPELEALRTIVFPKAGKSNTGLDKALSRRTIDGIIISDRGTRGLGGPLAADEVSQEGVYDWVDFVLNVGKPNPHDKTGGTYGFGKTITYIVSAANAVVIHTRTMLKGRAQTRLIACAIGGEFEHRGRLHTGRHWWGVEDDGAPSPTTGARADEIASSIGMPEFTGTDLGTNILVVSPGFGGRSPAEGMRFIAESVTWHLWPKLMSHERADVAPMAVSVSWNGEPVEVPRPEDRPPLHGFAQAFRAILDGVEVGRRADGLERVVIRSLRPKTDIGDLVTVPLVARRRAEVQDGHDSEQADSPVSSASITGVCHHVALLRAPELVVDYVSGPAPADGGSEWAAVFRARDDVDGHFAAAEPPTHDSWRPELLEKSSGKTIVKVGLQRINEFLMTRWGSQTESRPVAATMSTAVVADSLSSIIQSAPSLGVGGGTEGTARGGAGRRMARVEIVDTGVALVRGRPATTALVRVTPQASSLGTKIRITAGVALDETGSDPDLDPELMLLEAEIDGEVRPLSGTTSEVELAGTEIAEFTVTVARSPDSAVSIDVQSEAIPA